MAINPPSTLLALDVGEKRIGTAYADTGVRVPVARGVIAADGNEIDAIASLCTELEAGLIVIGFPRNQSGEETAQTQYVKSFAKKLEEMDLPYVFQDESLTSVLAEEYLKKEGKQYDKADIDARAAAIILEDYLELHYA